MNATAFRTILKASAATRVLCFAGNRSASTSAVFALSVFPVLGLVGAGIEYQRYNGLKAEAQAAADMAVLAVGAQPNASLDTHHTIASNVATASFATRSGVTVTVAASDVLDVTPGTTWQVTVHGAVSSIVGNLVGMPTLHFAATAKATNYGATAAKPLELALALDNTGSMSNNMTDLKSAAKNLVQQVLNGGGGAARVAIVPYVAAVNPGLTDATSIANYIDTTAVSPWNGVWLAGKWIDPAKGCTPSWGSSNGGAGSGGSGDARDILDILKPIRHMAQELFGVASAQAADVTPNTIAPIGTTTWKSSKTQKTYTMPLGFQGIAKDYAGSGSTGGCDYLSNPATVSQYELFARTLDPSGNAVKWKGCVEARVTKAEQTWLNSNWGQKNGAKTEYDVSETPPTTKDPLSLFVPYFWPDEPDYSPYTWDVVKPGAYSSSTQGFHNNYLDDGVGDIQSGWGWTAMGSVGWGNGQLLMKYDGKTKAAIIQETPDTAGFTYGPNAGCPDPVLRLTNNQSNAVSKINGLNYWQSGGTVISEGLMWAWRALSPNAPYADGAAYNTTGLTKAIVLMTDGVNELIDNGNNSKSFITANLSDYSAYGYLGGVRLQNANGITTYDGVNTFFDNRLLAACTAAKNAGVLIYTVTFNHAGFLTTAQQQHAQSILQQCASKTSNSFLATDASSLNSAFTSIATSATAGALRLIQ